MHLNLLEEAFVIEISPITQIEEEETHEIGSPLLSKRTNNNFLNKKIDFKPMSRKELLTGLRESLKKSSFLSKKRIQKFNKKRSMRIKQQDKSFVLQV